MKPREAQAAVAKAKRKGLLITGPCELADETCKGRIEAHHDDYDKPLEVRWLCVRHHGFVHRGQRRNQRPPLYTHEIKLRIRQDVYEALEQIAARETIEKGEFQRIIRVALREYVLRDQVANGNEVTA